MSSIQDLGRWGYQHEGVPLSGALDVFSAVMANRLLGNSPGEAVIEVTLMGFEAEVLDDVFVSITGGDLDARINGGYAEPWRAYHLKTGDRIAFRAPISGCRAYLAVEGGFDLQPIMGSYSTDFFAHFGGYRGRALQPGDVLDRRDPGHGRAIGGRRVVSGILPSYNENLTVRVVTGPQLESFSREAVALFFSSEYRVLTTSNRMGLRLEGQPVPPVTGELPPEGTPPGSIQVPADGQPIVLLRGCQTTGGYHKIGVVIAPDLDILAQARPGAAIVRFQAVTLKQAHEQYLRWCKALQTSDP